MMPTNGAMPLRWWNLSLDGVYHSIALCVNEIVARVASAAARKI